MNIHSTVPTAKAILRLLGRRLPRRDLEVHCVLVVWVETRGDNLPEIWRLELWDHQ